jgi:hypothetical protein
MIPKGTAANWPPPRTIDQAARDRYRGSVTFDASPAQIRQNLEDFGAELREAQARCARPPLSFMAKHGPVVIAAAGLAVIAGVALVGHALQ